MFQLNTQLAVSRIAAPLYSWRVLWLVLVLPPVFVLGAGPVWTSWLRELMGCGALAGPLWALSGATSHPTSECSSVSLINAVTPPILSSVTHTCNDSTPSARVYHHPPTPDKTWLSATPSNLITAQVLQKTNIITNMFGRRIKFLSFLPNGTKMDDDFHTKRS